MKKYIIFIIFLISITHLNAYEAANSFYVGIQTGSSNKTRDAKLEEDTGDLKDNSSFSFSFNYFDVGFFADIEYARFILNYSQTFSESQIRIDDGDSVSTNRYYISHKFIEPSLFLKYPFKNWVPNATLWPAVGLGYSYLLDSSSKYSDNIKYEISDNSYFNSYWLSAAIGVDFDISSSVMITAYGSISICLNPDLRFKYYSRDTNTETEMHFKDETAYKFVFNIGVGYKLK